MDIIAASELDIDTLVEVFASAYSDYFVPVKSDRQAFEDHLLHNDIDLGHSFAAIEGGGRDTRVVGLVLSGIRDDKAWVGGMGIVSEHRGKGIGLALMEGQLDNLDRIGIKHVQLEVIGQNEAAHKLYRKLGFKETRKLYSPASDIEFMLDVHPSEEIWEVPWTEIREHYTKGQCWQKDASSVDKMDKVMALMGLEGDDVIGHAVFLEREGTISLLDLGGEKDTLLHHIWQEYKPVKIVYSNISHATEKEYLEGKGFREFLWQWEMGLEI